MTINEFMNGLPNDSARALMGDQVSIWSNAACAGYCRTAMQAAGMTPDQIAAVLAELRAAFDTMAVEEAEKV